jgi:predicted nuclease of predicted toxin-antitoxin system
MKFLCDVHISYKLSKAISDLEYETIHVNNILDKWFTKDADISKFADNYDCILITKDADFRNSFYLNNTPKKLLKINFGNLPNTKLMELVVANMPFIEEINQKYDQFMIELDNNSISYFVQ